MQPRSSFSELLNSLDAATYFFVSSGIFITVTAALFFALGVWLGGLLWGRYKRRFREAEDVIEAFKGEVALLKRRIAEQSTRHSPGMGPNPLQAIAFKTSAPKAETAPSTAASQVAITAEDLPPFSVMDVFMSPRSRAFCIWTEENWIAPPVRASRLPVAHGFSIWTQPDFRPVCRGALPPGQAHSIWTLPDWTVPCHSGPPPRSARTFTVWTEPDFQPACQGVGLPSQAPAPTQTAPAPTQTAPAPTRAAPAPTRAAPAPTPAAPAPTPAAPAPTRAAPAPTQAAPASQTSIVAAAAAAVASITGPPPESDQDKGQGFMNRALAAAKQAFGRSAPASPEPAPTPARTAEPAKVFVKPTPTHPVTAASLAVTAAAIEALRQTERAPEMPAPPPETTGPPPCKAFSVWTGDPAVEPATMIAQRSALAALIRSKFTPGKTALQPARPTPVAPPPLAAPAARPAQLPPVPAVPVEATALASPATAAPAAVAPTGTAQDAVRHDETLGIA